MSVRTTEIELTVKTKLGKLGAKNQQRLLRSLATYLGISPQEIRIKRIYKGSLRLILELPTRAASKVLTMYKRRNSDLFDSLAPFHVLDMCRRAKTDRRSESDRPGRALERWVAQALRQIGASNVEQDVGINGNQVDIRAELEIAGFRHCVIVEVKDTSRPVGVHIVNHFANVFHLLRDAKPMIHEGVIVSAGGFTKQARDAAKTCAIRLLEPGDLDAMMRTDSKQESVIRHLALALADLCGLVLVPVSEGDGWRLGVPEGRT